MATTGSGLFQEGQISRSKQKGPDTSYPQHSMMGPQGEVGLLACLADAVLAEVVIVAEDDDFAWHSGTDAQAVLDLEGHWGKKENLSPASTIALPKTRQASAPETFWTRSFSVMEVGTTRTLENGSTVALTTRCP